MRYKKIALYEYFEADALHSTVSPVTLITAGYRECLVYAGDTHA